MSIGKIPRHWTPSTFAIVGPGGAIEEKTGYVTSGLGMWRAMIERHVFWSLVHLGSGHRVILITAPEPEAFTIADRFVALSDWDFDGLDGWRNRDPLLGDKLTDLAVELRRRNQVVWGSRGHDVEAAQRIAETRA